MWCPFFWRFSVEKHLLVDVKYIVLFILTFQLFFLQERTVIGSSELRESIDCRERREFTFMTVSERIRFVNVLKRVSTEPAFSQRYTELVYYHPKLFHIVHDATQFFPWHRYYLLQMEELLREAEPNITLPYWDWSLVSASPWRNAALDIWTSLPWGLGGNGSEGNFCVTTGPFAPGEWGRARNVSDHGCLQRNFSGIPPGIMAVHRALRFSPKHFHMFEHYVREFLHNALHLRVGGTLAGKAASFAPEFFLHHAFLDKIWADYQKESRQHKWAYFKNANHSVYNTTIQVRMLVDNDDLLGIRVCYKDPFESYGDIHRKLKKYSVEMIRSFMNNGAFEYPFENFNDF